MFVCLSPHLLHDIRIVSSLGWLRLKPLSTFSRRFYCARTFHFSCANTKDWGCLLCLVSGSLDEVAKLKSFMLRTREGRVEGSSRLWPSSYCVPLTEARASHTWPCVVPSTAEQNTGSGCPFTDDPLKR